MKLKLKKLASHLAISFFFAAIFILIFYFFIDEKVSVYISLINTTAVKENTEDIKTEYNFAAKKLLRYPNYGQKYGTIKIPSININLPLYFGDTMKILRKGVGHFAGSYFPGENGTTILAAHNNIGFFNELDKVKKGDIVTIQADYGTFNYEVESYKIIKETDLSAFPIQHEEERLIMYTCYPMGRYAYGQKTKRYVVYAKRIGDTSNAN